MYVSKYFKIISKVVKYTCRLRDIIIHIIEYVQGTKTVYYLLYKIEGILSTVHKIMYFMNNMLTSRDNVLPGC